MPVLCNCKLIQLQIGEIFPHLKTIIFLKLLYIHNIEYKKNHRLIFIAKQYSVDVSNLLTPKYLIFMKIIHLLISIVIFFVATANAQPPEKMSYQAVVRNEKGALVTNRTIGLKVSIQKFTFAIPKPFYTTIYAETHTPATNENGLISIAIGTGSVIAGSVNFADINWSAENYYLRTDMDLSGGTGYHISSTQQVLSVPYAFTAKTAQKADTASKASKADISNKLIVETNQGNTFGKIKQYYFKTGYSSPMNISAKDLGLTDRDIIDLNVISMEVGWAPAVLNSATQFRGLKDGITYEIYFDIREDFCGIKIYFPEKTEYYDKQGRMVYMLLE